MMTDTQYKNDAPPIYDNSLYRRLIIRPLAKKIAIPLADLGLSANGVCWLKLASGLIGAFILSAESAAVCFIGMLFLQMNFMLDAADGEVARIRGEASKLSGEYIDKLFDHLPKTAMYFFWGFGTFRLTGSYIPLFCGAFFSAWNIYPRFCAVETLLERMDKAPAILENSRFHDSVKSAFVINQQRGKADFVLTMFIHPSMNLLTIFFVLEIIMNEISFFGFIFSSRYLFLLIFTITGVMNFFRKSIRFNNTLNF